MIKHFRKNFEKYLLGLKEIDHQLREKILKDTETIIHQLMNPNMESDENRVIIEGIILDRMSYTLSIDGKEIKRTSKEGKKVDGITKKEFELLDLLMRNPGIVYTRKTLLDRIWGDNVVVGDRTVDVHICKIKDLLGKKYEEKIISRKGIGYKFQL